MDEPDVLRDLPGLARFGTQLEAAARRAQAPPARRAMLDRSLRGLVLAALMLLAVAATAAATTALVLRAGVITAPAPVDVAPEQTPQAGTALVSAPRAADPAGGPPWALRVARGRTGLTCTTVGQVRAGAFGIVGRDGLFRRLPAAISDACGDAGTLLGARVVAAADQRAVRSIVYGVGGPRLRRATLISTHGRRTLELGERGAFVAALRGFPEDSAIRVQLRFAGGRTERHSLGAAPGILPDAAGGAAWRLERLVLGTRQFCARLSQIRRSEGNSTNPPVSTPTACLNRRGTRAWVVDARRLRPDDRGVPGFDRWSWRDHPARTVVWGVARGGDVVRAVTLLGAGKPRRLDVTSKGTFAAVLRAQVDPRRLRLVVELRDAAVHRERAGMGLAADHVASRRAR